MVLNALGSSGAFFSLQPIWHLISSGRLSSLGDMLYGSSRGAPSAYCPDCSHDDLVQAHFTTGCVAARSVPRMVLFCGGSQYADLDTQRCECVTFRNNTLVMAALHALKPGRIQGYAVDAKRHHWITHNPRVNCSKKEKIIIRLCN